MSPLALSYCSYREFQVRLVLRGDCFGAARLAMTEERSPRRGACPEPIEGRLAMTKTGPPPPTPSPPKGGEEKKESFPAKASTGNRPVSPHSFIEERTLKNTHPGMGGALGAMTYDV